MKKFSVVFSLLLLLAEPRFLFSQVEPVLIGSVAPFEIWNFAGRKMGGVSVGLADDVPSTLINPANLASLNRLQIFSSLNNARKNFNARKNVAAKTSWTQGLQWGYSAAAVPFRLFSRRWVVAASYNGRQWREFDERYLNKASTSFGDNVRNGHVYSFSAGMGVQLYSSIRAGLSWTAWSGESDWRLAEGFVKGHDDNKAQGWQAGLAADMGRFSIGSTVSFPHRVLSSKLTRMAWTAGRTEITQQYNGGLEIGLGYHPWLRWTFGLGYGLQRGFDFKSPQIPAEIVEYPSSFKVSTGVEYRFSGAKVQMPVYVGFQAFWLTKETAVLYSYVQIPTPEEKRNRSHWVMGGAIQAGSWAIHLDGRLTWDDFRLYDGYVPPWS